MKPSNQHPITIEANPNHVIVRFGGVVIADTRKSLTLREANNPPVLYIPRNDVDLTRLNISEVVTHCPYKGDAEHYSISTGDKMARDAAWSYRTPYPELSKITDHIAFYPERVDAIEEWGA